MLKPIGLALIATALAVSSASAQTRYRLIDLGVPGDSDAARAISDNGKIAGIAGTADGGQSAVRLDGAAAFLPQLPPDSPGPQFTDVHAINNAGMAAGFTGNDRAAVFTTGGATELFGSSGFTAAGALGINNAGRVTGYVLDTGAEQEVDVHIPQPEAFGVGRTA